MQWSWITRLLLWACWWTASHAWSLATAPAFGSLKTIAQENYCRSRSPQTALQLFYKPPPAKAATTTRRFFVPETIEKDWSEGRVQFPYSFPVASGKQSIFTTSRPKLENATLTIRLMEWKDLQEITDMCVREYSSYSSTIPTLGESSALSPWDKFTNWLDQATLGPYVKLSMILKLLLDYAPPKLPSDHAVLVASVTEESRTQERLVGMVEVSRQPAIPERNPPAIPFPLWFKEGYCRLLKKQSTQGWITNLLIVPEYRGRGWAKALVMACEGIARCWSTHSIHLHCDASYRVPQKLYRSLGYQTEASAASEYSWMSNNDYCQSSVYVIDGVPLLYMCKKL